MSANDARSYTLRLFTEVLRTTVVLKAGEDNYPGVGQRIVETPWRVTRRIPHSEEELCLEVERET